MSIAAQSIAASSATLDRMPLLSSLEIGTFGLRLEPNDSLVVMEEDEESVRLNDRKGVGFWLYLFHDLHMDLSTERLDAFQRAAHCHAREMFNKMGEADDYDETLRTEDASWSPLVDFEVHEVCGAPALRTVHRMVYRPGREVVMGHLLVPLETGLFEARVVATAHTTGFRESALAILNMNDGSKSVEDYPKIDQGIFDAVELDSQFPEHCLSQVREGLRTVSSWIADVGLPAHKIEHTKVELRKLGGWITPPRGFVHVIASAEKQIAYFGRVSFCGTDGLDNMTVTIESKKRHEPGELLALAESMTLERHENSGCTDIELTVAEHPRDSGGVDVSVVVDFHGNQGRSRNHLYWFLDAKGRALSIARISVVALPNDEVLRESQETARSWQPSKFKLW